MARCEDFPCCGHELGCCPDFDENGKQLNMVCVCGAKLPVNAPYSICSSCMEDEYGDDPYDDWDAPYADDGFFDDDDGFYDSPGDL